MTPLAHNTRPRLGDVFISTRPGTAATAHSELNRALAGYPNLKLLDQAGLKQQARSQVSTLTKVVLALLGVLDAIAAQ